MNAGSARPARTKAIEARQKAEAADVYVGRIRQGIEQTEAQAAEQRKAALDVVRQRVRVAHQEVVKRMAGLLRQLAVVEVEEEALRHTAVSALGGSLAGTNIFPPDAVTLTELGREDDPRSDISRWLRTLREHGYPV